MLSYTKKDQWGNWAAIIIDLKILEECYQIWVIQFAVKQKPSQVGLGQIWNSSQWLAVSITKVKLHLMPVSVCKVQVSYPKSEVICKVFYNFFYKNI